MLVQASCPRSCASASRHTYVRSVRSRKFCQSMCNWSTATSEGRIRSYPPCTASRRPSVIMRLQQTAECTSNSSLAVRSSGAIEPAMSSSSSSYSSSTCSTCQPGIGHAMQYNAPEQSRGAMQGLWLSRRSTAHALAGLTLAALSMPCEAWASKLPTFADQAWESLGGGPADLYFPDSFLGVWDVVSVLVGVEKPMGEEFITNKPAVERAIRDDLNKQTRYKVSFIKGPDGRTIFDRRYNTASMVGMYYGPSVDFLERISWNPRDPNVLRLSIPGGMSVRTRVTRRSADAPSADRLETSEYFEQIYDDGMGPPRLKASQCFTKYKWRDAQVAARAGGPTIVATQVVSDFLTIYDGEALYMKAMNKPVVTYTYKMAFSRPAA